MELRKGHAAVNTAIVISAGEGIVMGHDASLLACNGGDIELTKDWAKSLMKRMGFSKCKATTKSSLSQFDFDKVREIYLNDVASIVLLEEIPLSLIMQLGPNWYSLCSCFSVDYGGQGFSQSRSCRSQ